MAADSENLATIDKARAALDKAGFWSSVVDAGDGCVRVVLRLSKGGDPVYTSPSTVREVRAWEEASRWGGVGSVLALTYMAAGRPLVVGGVVRVAPLVRGKEEP